MYRVLEPASLHRIRCRNRVIRSATWDASADNDGSVTDTSVAIFEKLARGGVGLIVTGYVYASESGKGNPSSYGAHDDRMIGGLARLVKAAHANGAAIVAQLVHCGMVSYAQRLKGAPALAPSLLEERQPHRAMTEDDIEQVMAGFEAGARRIVEAGFDGVQFHGGHGYLFSQFHSSLTNKREDRWGGDAMRRGRFHVEAVRRVRAAIGPDYPLGIKLGIKDDLDGGAALEDGLQTLRAMIEAGLDWVEISAGLGHPKGRHLKGKAEVKETTFFRERAAVVKRAVEIPVAVVGGIRALDTAEDIVQSGEADFVSLSRSFIREPDLVARWTGGDGRRSGCTSCYKCASSLHRGKPLNCYEAGAISERSALREGQPEPSVKDQR